MKKIIIIAALLMVCSMYPASAETQNPEVALETTYGTIVVALNKQKAPKTVDNFLTYVKEGFYDNTIFHRVIKKFMIQGGGFTPQMVKKDTHSSIQNEADNGLSNVIGTIAMARTNDPHSATAQFFINTKDNLFLDHRGKNPAGWGYCVFGKVVDGMDVVQKIENVNTGVKAGYQDVPMSDVIIKKAYVVENKAETQTKK